MKRSCGILLPVFSLPSLYGIGTFGSAAYQWINFLKKSGQEYWQVLPLGPTGYGDSPYQSFSSFAGNPYFIDLEILCKQRLLTVEECAAPFWGKEPGRVDYHALYQGRLPLLRKAFSRFDDTQMLMQFRKGNQDWLEDYALYSAVKAEQNQRPWNQWPEPLRLRDYAAVEEAKHRLKPEIDFYCFVQYLFFQQWRQLKQYANQNGIRIIGDIPIYVAMDSADAWTHQELFCLDESGIPTEVAGCPPDAFSVDGQLWGNPLYRWEVHKEEDYRWWMHRLHANLSLYDLLRIDHFRGLESYYAVPYGEKTAVHGRWRKGPGINFLNLVNHTFGAEHFIAEDLGYLTPEVEALLCSSGFPGMKVLQFAFDTRETGGSTYLPHNYSADCVVYTGTHDNDTTKGWFRTVKPADADLAREYLHIMKEDDEVWSFIRGAVSSVAELAVIPMQDYLELGSSARLNTPSTTNGQNWRWRMKPSDCNDILAGKIARLMGLYGRHRS